MKDLRDLIRDLEAWTLDGSDFHKDRQLADEVLLADGWNVEHDVDGHRGVLWTWGTNPKIMMADDYRHHPINDLNAAFGVIPYGFNFRIGFDGVTSKVVLWPRGDVTMGRSTEGESSRVQVAIIIASLKQKLNVGSVA